MKLTVAFIFIVIAAIVGFDIYAITTQGREASISWVLIQSAYEYPMIPFCIGFVMGHLFWRMKSPNGGDK